MIAIFCAGLCGRSANTGLDTQKTIKGFNIQPKGWRQGVI
jgi:hypothetical protein